MSRYVRPQIRLEDVLMSKEIKTEFIEVLEEVSGVAPFYPTTVALTCFSEEERETFSRKLARYSIEVVDSCDDADILVVKKLIANKKTISAVVSGVRLCSEAYLEAILASEVKLNANDYELGSPLCDVGMNNDVVTNGKDCYDDRKNIAEAGYRWRNVIETSGEKPFQGWLVALYLDPIDRRLYGDIIECGGGTVFDWKSVPYTLATLTHAVVAEKDSSLWINNEMLKKLINAKVSLYNEELIMNTVVGVETQFHRLYTEFRQKQRQKRCSSQCK